MKEIQLMIPDMDCASCVSHIEQDVSGMEGVKKIAVNFAIGKARVTFDDSKISPDDIVERIKKTGYTAHTEDNGHSSHHDHHGGNHDHAAMESEREVRSKMMKVAFGAVASLALTVLGFWVDIPSEGVVMMLITLFILVYTGAEFFRKGVPALLKGRPQMDTLVVLGVSTAFLYSSYNILFTSSHEEYFMDAAVISTFIMLGRYLEARAKGNAGAAIQKLLSLGAKMAHKAGEKNTIKDISIDDVKKGDLLLVKPGEKVPVDGVITEGTAMIDESMVTGESFSVDKRKGDFVIGSTLNGTTSFTMEAQKVGKETMLAQMIQLVEEAQMNKPPIQKLVDTVSSYFVWGVIAIALVTFVAWNSLSGSAELALIPTVAVLIVACPCALGLATPISIVAGSGKGAELGILLKRPESLEKMNKITAVCFDKTGTITEGKLHVTDVMYAVGNPSKSSLQLLASVERQSEHPLAQAVVSYAEQQDISFLDAQNVKAVPGQGVQGTVKGSLVSVGNRRFVLKHDVKPDASLDKKAIQLEEQGKTVLFFSVDEMLRGIIAVQDTPKQSSQDAIALLHEQNIKTVMMTGDSQGLRKALPIVSALMMFSRKFHRKRRRQKYRSFRNAVSLWRWWVMALTMHRPSQLLTLALPWEPEPTLRLNRVILSL